MGNKRDDSGPNPGPTGGARPQKATLSTQQVAAIAAIVSGSTYDDAAKAAGVHRRSLYEWRTQDEGFMAALDEALAAMKREVTDGLVAGAREALRSIVNLATKAEDEKVRLSAAQDLLQRLDGASGGTATAAPSAGVTVVIAADDAVAELRRRRSEG